MNCPNPKCKNKNTNVRDVRIYQTFKHRLRHCPICGTIFQTSEKLIEGTIIECNYEPLQEQLPFFKKKDEGK